MSSECLSHPGWGTHFSRRYPCKPVWSSIWHAHGCASRRSRCFLAARRFAQLGRSGRGAWGIMVTDFVADHECGLHFIFRAEQVKQIMQSFSVNNTSPNLPSEAAPEEDGPAEILVDDPNAELDSDDGEPAQAVWAPTAD
eukprot:9474061-Pyramimonas_sp.AAC.1